MTLTILTTDNSMAGSVIQASGMVLFEDALKAGTLVVDTVSAASFCATPVVNLEPHVTSQGATERLRAH